MIIWCALCREGISPLVVRFSWCQQRSMAMGAVPPLTAICCLEICYPSTHPPPSLIIGYSLTSTQKVQTNAICVAMKMFQSFICCKPKCNILKSQSVNYSSFFPDLPEPVTYCFSGCSCITSLASPANKAEFIYLKFPSKSAGIVPVNIDVVKNNAGYNCKLNVI